MVCLRMWKSTPVKTFSTRVVKMSLALIVWNAIRKTTLTKRHHKRSKEHLKLISVENILTGFLLPLMKVGKDNCFQESHHHSLNPNNLGFLIQILAKC